MTCEKLLFEGPVKEASNSKIPTEATIINPKGTVDSVDKKG